MTPGSESRTVEASQQAVLQLTRGTMEDAAFEKIMDEVLARLNVPELLQKASTS